MLWTRRRDGEDGAYQERLLRMTAGDNRYNDDIGRRAS
jgi:hypothetical protein